jgi:hypothetical protein
VGGVIHVAPDRSRTQIVLQHTFFVRRETCIYLYTFHCYAIFTCIGQ